MNEVKAKGFILRAIRTKESDLVVKILTQKGDKVSAYARAALKSKKRFTGGLQPLTQIEFRLSERMLGELPLLEESKLLLEFSNLSQSIEVLSLSSYLCELCDHCAQVGLENEQLYNLFGAALKAFDQSFSPYGIVSQFEVKLLSLMGWLPDLKQLRQEDKNILVLLLTQKISDTKLSVEQAQKISGLTKNWIKQQLGEKHFKSLDVFSSFTRFQKQDVMFNPEKSTNQNKDSN